jgi:hypothetical protein
MNRRFTLRCFSIRNMSIFFYLFHAVSNSKHVLRLKLIMFFLREKQFLTEQFSEVSEKEPKTRMKATRRNLRVQFSVFNFLSSFNLAQNKNNTNFERSKSKKSWKSTKKNIFWVISNQKTFFQEGRCIWKYSHSISKKLIS